MSYLVADIKKNVMINKQRVVHKLFFSAKMIKIKVEIIHKINKLIVIDFTS